MNKRCIVSFLIILFALITRSQMLLALDIPLSGGGGETSGTGKIGYVDMQKIFQIYPQTLDAKEDYLRQLKKKRDELSKREQELIDTRNKIAVLEQTVKGASATQPVDESTSPVQAPVEPTQSVESMKANLEAKKGEYEEARKQALDELSAFENKQSQLILGKIYQALKDLAAEEQVTLVVDKSSILFGSAEIDLTEKLQNKVRGY